MTEIASTYPPRTGRRPVNSRTEPKRRLCKTKCSKHCKDICDGVRELLEQLDDVIFAAIGGCELSLAEARALWPELVDQLGCHRIEESRKQYLRFAIDVTEQFEAQAAYSDEQGWRSAERAIAALEIISLLTKS